jgi:hypothetical protein
MGMAVCVCVCARARACVRVGGGGRDRPSVYIFQLQNCPVNFSQVLCLRSAVKCFR